MTGGLAARDSRLTPGVKSAGVRVGATLIVLADPSLGSEEEVNISYPADERVSLYLHYFKL